MVTFDPVWILYALLAVGVLVLVLRFWKWLTYGMLVGGVLVAVVTLASAFNRQARATEQVAVVATRASTGQTLLVVLLALVLVVLVAAGLVIGVLVLRLRRAELPRARDAQRIGAWGPGPNANWQRDAPNPGVPDVGASVQSLVQLELLRTLREFHEPEQGAVYALPPASGQGEDYAAEETYDAEWGW